MNIISIDQMIDSLDDFVNSSHMENHMIVGGVVGTEILRYALDSVTAVYPWERVLVIDGCQDYIGMLRNPISNYVYYADIFDDFIIDNPFKEYNPWKPSMFNPKPDYGISINMDIVSKYKFIVVMNAHLIPEIFINMMLKYICCNMIFIVDPCDINGEKYKNVITVVDSLNKLSPIEAFARNVYDIETRVVDKNVKCNMNIIKRISRRSIGKMDDKQYITNDDQLLKFIQSRQLQTKFRKNQKLLITDKRINIAYGSDQLRHALTNNSMCVIHSVSGFGNQVRFYGSRTMYTSYNGTCGEGLCEFTYDDDDKSYKIHAKPANIISINDCLYHRYKHSVLIQGTQLSKRQHYTLLKNSLNVSLAYV